MSFNLIFDYKRPANFHWFEFSVYSFTISKNGYLCVSVMAILGLGIMITWGTYK